MSAAVRAAAAAAEALVRARAASIAAGSSAAEIGRVGDRVAQEAIASLLGSERPGDAVLSEEADDSGARLDAGRVWIVDPLDGTREYSEPGRADWAVHVALWQRGSGITDAAVALPALGLIADTASVAHVQGDVGRPPRIVVSARRPPGWLPDLRRRLDASVSGLGSAGAKAMAVVTGEVDAYVHDGGQYEWDSAAPVGVALAAGLHASRLDGSPLVYNRPDPYLPDLVICRAELTGALLDALAAVA